MHSAYFCGHLIKVSIAKICIVRQICDHIISISLSFDYNSFPIPVPYLHTVDVSPVNGSVQPCCRQPLRRTRSGNIRTINGIVMCHVLCVVLILLTSFSLPSCYCLNLAHIQLSIPILLYVNFWRPVNFRTVCFRVFSLDFHDIEVKPGVGGCLVL